MSKPTQSGFSPRLRDIKESFPMPGNYHFRFKAPLIPGSDREKGSFAVWMDCPHDDQHVGVWRNTIFAKVTRINMEEREDGAGASPVHVHAPAHAPARTATAQTATRQASARARAPAPAPTPARAPATTPAPAPVAESGNLLGVFDEQPQRQTHARPAPSAYSSEGNLLGAPAPHQTQHREASLLDMNGPAYSSGGSNNNSNHDDFLGMTSAPVGQTQAPNPAANAAPMPMPTGMPVQGQPPASFGQGQGQPQNNSFNTFSSNNGPFGGLEWNKM